MVFNWIASSQAPRNDSIPAFLRYFSLSVRIWGAIYRAPTIYAQIIYVAKLLQIKLNIIKNKIYVEKNLILWYNGIRKNTGRIS